MAYIHSRVHLPNICFVIVIAFPWLVYLSTRRPERYWLSTCGNKATSIDSVRQATLMIPFSHVYHQQMGSKPVANICTSTQFQSRGHISTSDKCLSNESVRTTNVVSTKPTPHTRSFQLDKPRESHFRRQLSQELHFNPSTQTYGSNTGQRLKERNQRC